MQLTPMLTDAGAAAEPKPATGQEWDGLVKKAGEEGEVAIYATDSIGNAQSIWTAFQKRYPKIKLTGTSAGPGSDLSPNCLANGAPASISQMSFSPGPPRSLSTSTRPKSSTRYYRRWSTPMSTI